ncbi:TPA: hypothetical protein PXO92_004555 [Yersinia enterocolitica]|nr:hypothetical protein [Yersinia enterocolitica]
MMNEAYSVAEWISTQSYKRALSYRSCGWGCIDIVNAKIVGRFSPFLMSAIGH